MDYNLLSMLIQPSLKTVGSHRSIMPLYMCISIMSLYICISMSLYICISIMSLYMCINNVPICMYINNVPVVLPVLESRVGIFDCEAFSVCLAPLPLWVSGSSLFSSVMSRSLRPDWSTMLCPAAHVHLVGLGVAVSVNEPAAYTLIRTAIWSQVFCSLQHIENSAVDEILAVSGALLLPSPPMWAAPLPVSVILVPVQWHLMVF